MDEAATYYCDSCGEENSLSIDVSAGESQEFIEDCPVCCRPNLIHVELDESGAASVWATRENE